MPRFDWTISLGQIVNALMVLMGLGFLAQRMYYSLDKRVSVIETELKSFAAAVAREAAQHVASIQQQIEVHAEAVERQIEMHAKTLEDHAKRMERWETTLFKVVGDLQRVIGQLGSRFERREGFDRRDE